MSEEQNREQKALKKIAQITYKLDDDLNNIKRMKEEEPKKEHDLAVWVTEKKALHEIKKILHEVGHYENYDEAAYATEAAYLSTYLTRESYFNGMM